MVDLAIFCKFFDGFFYCTRGNTDCNSDFSERFFRVSSHDLLNLYRSFYRTFYRTVVRLFGRSGLLFPECSGKDPLRFIVSERETILGQESGYARDVCADTFDKVHPGEHLEDERIPGAAAVTEVCCDIGQQAARVGDFEAVVVELHHDLCAVVEVVAVADGVGQGFFDGIEGQFPNLLARVETVHNVFHSKVLLDPGCGVVVLGEKRAFEDFGVDAWIKGKMMYDRS